MSHAIHRFLKQGPPTPEQIDAFLAEHDFPLAEEGSATFVFRGQVDEVLLQHFIFGLPTATPFQHVEGTDLWFLVMDLPAGSRVEYKLNVIIGENQRWIQDPLNPRLARDPFGANSVVQASGYEEPEWAKPDPEARPGELQDLELESAALGRTMHAQVYLPARFRRRRRYPLLVAHDGHDFLTFSNLKAVLDNLIHRQEIPPMIVALTSSERRLDEYADDPNHARFISEELLSHLELSYPLDPQPAARGLMGASFGAVASLSTAWRYQRTWSRLLLLSGSFAFTDIGDQHPRGPAFDPVVQFVNAFRDDPGEPAEKIFLACGTYESLIYENRSMVPRLQEAGIDVRFVEARDGHNWENWRDRLREGLSWLFPGPLWMIYE